MVVQNLVEQLRGELNAGRLAPDGRLPPERLLAAELGVSRGSLRKAFEALEREGRIWRHVGQGTFAGRNPAAPDGTASGLMTLSSPAEVMEVRLILEPRVAALATLRASAAEVAEMARLAAACTQAGDVAAFEQADGRLHRSIAAAARNSMLLNLLDQVDTVRRSELWGRLKAASLTGERRQIYIRQHERIVAAIRDRLSDQASRRMEEHLLTVQRHLLR